MGSGRRAGQYAAVDGTLTARDRSSGADGRGGDSAKVADVEDGDRQDGSRQLASHELVRALEKAAQGLLLIDADGWILWTNRAASELLARPPEDLVGARLGRPIGPGDHVEIEVLTTGPTRTLELRTSAAEIDGAPVTVVSVHDVTARVAAEERLSDLVRQTRIGLAEAGHELKSPLSSIHLSVSSLLSPSPDGVVPEEQVLDGILELTSTAIRRVDTFLRIARHGVEAVRPERESVAVSEVLTAVVDGLGINDQVRVVSQQSPRCFADVEHCHQIFANVLGNAVKYGRPPYELVVREHDGHVVVTVRDHGPGVPDEFVPRLFDRFTRAMTRDEQGTGLGLAIVQGLASANGGCVSYRHADPGAMFEVRLPT